MALHQHVASWLLAPATEPKVDSLATPKTLLTAGLVTIAMPLVRLARQPLLATRRLALPQQNVHVAVKRRNAEAHAAALQREHAVGDGLADGFLAIERRLVDRLRRLLLPQDIPVLFAHGLHDGQHCVWFANMLKRDS